MRVSNDQLVYRSVCVWASGEMLIVFVCFFSTDATRVRTHAYRNGDRAKLRVDFADSDAHGRARQMYVS